MSVWILMLAAGLVTFGIRFSLIFLFGRFDVPEPLSRALRYVPPAVLSAIVAPELFFQDGRLALTLDNPRLLAGLAAIVVAWFSKSTLLTILAGMAALVALRLAAG